LDEGDGGLVTSEIGFRGEARAWLIVSNDRRTRHSVWSVDVPLITRLRLLADRHQSEQKEEP
jgi:hypothetical protein